MDSIFCKIYSLFGKLYADKSSRWPFYLTASIIILLIVYQLSPPLTFLESPLRAYSVAKHDIIVQSDVQIIDEHTTNLLKNQAAKNTGLFFTTNDLALQQDLALLDKVFEEYRKKEKPLLALIEKVDTKHHHKFFAIVSAQIKQRDLLDAQNFKPSLLLTSSAKNKDDKTNSSPSTNNLADIEKIFDRLAKQQIILQDYLSIKKTFDTDFASFVKQTNQKLAQDHQKLIETLLTNLGIPISFLVDNKIYLRQLLADKSLEVNLKKIIKEIHQSPFIEDKTIFSKKTTTAVNIIKPNHVFEKFATLATVTDKSSIISQVASQYARQWESEKTNELYKLFLSQIVSANLLYSDQITSQELTATTNEIRDVRIWLKKGEVLIRQGEKISPEKVALLQNYQKVNTNIVKYPRILGLLVLVLLSIGILLLVTNSPYKHIELLRYRRKWTLITLTSLLIQILLSGFILEISIPIFNSFPSFLRMAQLYIMPIGISSILATILIRYEIAIAISIASAIFTSLLFTGNPNGLLFTLLSNIVLGLLLVNIKVASRSAILLIGVKLAFVNAFLVIIISALNYPSTAEGVNFTVIGLSMFCGAIGALISVISATVLLPMLERLFDVKTDINLLEWSTTNHPVLKELMEKAPGSYYHSMSVGAISEAGAMKIGANALFCRIAAYYHDIGKIHNPSFFIENMRGYAKNTHLLMDDPIKSKEIIIGHVAKGKELAKKYHLGRQLTDIIEEHHGTSLVRYFYVRAQEKLALGLIDAQQVDEKKFRYPGPKPQSPESALIMIADVCEAAVRSLSSPSLTKIADVVKNVSNHILEDGQLDDSRINLRDFKAIQAVYTDMLIAQNHSRIYTKPS